MPEIIKNGRVQSDDWQVLRLAEGEAAADAVLPAGHVIVPLATWQARRAELLPKAEAGTLGVWLAGDEDPAALAADLPALPVVAVDFPKFADGRGYSLATLLRTRLAYEGELRAIGDVLRDQFFFLLRCGFSVLQPREGKYTTAQLEAALASLRDFTNPYQGAVDRPEPLFRRQPRSPRQEDAAR
ncbi:DUF934 domain-containing protein [Thauera linaloolentis]|uniref:Oxidoreductase n=1 Tax=Thauera linaloolentis (strain DSM 12138 / JCM 21573 / CCUG 41526 / CIP 105981 / IAM 15112 / NBRC 102519 / 47Lol) TaxID=1123367 RepID=N6Z529_THAL4|nr:DUF934 domain-containing protein [Thauera linaloolentis]ENO89682.1 hypothetical protein C666_05200 [Thauera linaloolentis 47Lol = DSM 12138]MCM8567162.1 DUF934 domain-containing protein [Thauera linaloolentis]